MWTVSPLFWRTPLVLVLPSIEEGVPLVINEALAMEVPVVSSRVGAIEEALPPACGVLIENDGREAQSFASTLCELLRDPARREKLGTEGRRFVEIHYDLRRARRRYRDLIEETFPTGSGADCGANRSRETKKRSKLGAGGRDSARIGISYSPS